MYSGAAGPLRPTTPSTLTPLRPMSLSRDFVENMTPTASAATTATAGHVAPPREGPSPAESSLLEDPLRGVRRVLPKREPNPEDPEGALDEPPAFVSPLDHRGAACMNGDCTKCGFKRLWSHGVRPLLYENGQLRGDVHPAWFTKVKWQIYKNEPVPPVREKADPDYGQGKRTKLTVVDQTGTVVDFLDHLEGRATNHLKHRSTLARQRASALQFDRQRQPGMMSRDTDYGEKYTIKEGRLIQSEHWCSCMLTMFVSVVEWLSVEFWDKTTGLLPLGAHVTANGGFAGETLEAGAFWATVVGESTDGGVPVYVVADEFGTKHHFLRSALRHRVLKKHCFLSVTGDKKQGSYSMRAMTQKEWKWLHENGVFERELITSLCTHSDNCATHFKSSATLEWYTSTYRGASAREEVRVDRKNGLSYTKREFKTYYENKSKAWMQVWDAAPRVQVTADGTTTARKHATWDDKNRCFDGMNSMYWDFGPPGHGKGVWDGLFGMFKQWLRTRANEALTDTTAITTTSGRIAKGFDCFQMLRNHFDCDTWREAHRDRAISRITVFWFEKGEIKRPLVPEVHVRCVDILKTYQFLVLRPGHVARRGHSCWCAACNGVALRGPLSGVLGHRLHVPSCIRYKNDFYEWENRPVAQLTGPAAAKRRSDRNTKGRTHARQLVSGDWVLVAARDHDTEELWLGRCVPNEEWEGRCTDAHKGRPANIGDTAFNTGDIAITVQWYGRVPSDSERRTFRIDEDEHDIFNATELRLSGFNPELVEGPPLPLRPRRGTRSDIELANDRARVWHITAETEALALVECDG